MVIRARNRVFFTQNLVEIRLEDPTVNGNRLIRVTVVPAIGEAVRLEGEEAESVWSQTLAIVNHGEDSVKNLLNG